MSRVHVIEEATFDVSFDAARVALRQEGLLPGLIRDRLLPLADEIFCGFSGDDTVLKLDSLELDLGDIPYPGFEYEIERRFKVKLASALDARKHALVKLPATEKAADAIAAFVQLAQLKDFLETGVLDGGTLRSGIASIDQLLSASIRNESTALVRFLKTTPHRAVVSRRLARQFHHLHVATIIDLFVAGDGKRLNQMVNRFAADLRSDARHAQHEGELRAEIWERILTEYLAADDRAPEAVQLFHDIVRHVSALRLPDRTDEAGPSRMAATPEHPAANLRSVPDSNISSRTAEVRDATVVEGAAAQAAGMAANETERSAIPPEQDRAGRADTHLQAIVRRSQGQPGPEIGQLIEQLMQLAPASLERLFQQWQSGAIPLHLESIDGREARQLVRAFLEVRHGTTDGPFVQAIELQAARANSSTHYYRRVLDQLLRGQNVDLEAAAAALPAETAATPIGPANAYPETGHAGATTDTERTPLLSTLLKRAMADGRTDELAQVWEESRVQYADLIRQSFMRHAGEEGGIDRIARSFPEFILQDLATTVGQLTQQASALMAALPHHPILRRELNVQRNSRYWAYTLNYLRTHAGVQFNQADYLLGLLQRFPEIDAGAAPHSPVSGELAGVGAVYKRLLAEARAARSSATPQGADGEQAKAASREGLPDFFANDDPATEATQAYPDTARRIQEQRGVDLVEAITSPIAPSSVQRQPASAEQAMATSPTVSSLEDLPGSLLNDPPYTEARQDHADAALHLKESRGSNSGKAMAPSSAIRQSISEAEATTGSSAALPTQGLPESFVDDLPSIEATQAHADTARHLQEKHAADFGEPIASSITPSSAIRQSNREEQAMAATAAVPLREGLPGAPPSAEAAQAYAKIVAQLQQGHGSGLGEAIAILVRTAPASLAYLLQQWQAGEIHADVEVLGDLEAKQLLHAAVGLSSGPGGVELQQAMEARASRTPDATLLYRRLLKRFLQKQNPATGSAAADHPSSSAAAMRAAEAASVITQRLQGPAGESGNISSLVDATLRDAPATLARLFQRWSSGEIEARAEHLDADEARSLLHAYTEVFQDGWVAELLHTAEMNPGHTGNATAHYRDLLHGAILAAKEKQGNAQAMRADDVVPTSPGMEKEKFVLSRLGETASAEVQYERLLQRLQGRQEASIAGLIEQMRQSTPSALQRLFKHLQSGDIPNDLAGLDAAETLQLLRAYIHLQLGADDALLRNIETRAAQSPNVAEHYRGLLKQLLHKATPGAAGHTAQAGAGQLSAGRTRRPGPGSAVPRSVASSGATGPVSSEAKLEPQTGPDIKDSESPSHISTHSLPPPPGLPVESAKESEADAQAAQLQGTVANASMEGISPAGAGRRLDAAIWPIAQRLRALSKLNITEMVKAMQDALADGNMPLQILHRQLQSGEIRWQVDHLDGGEAHQLLRAFILLQRQAGNSDFLQAIESHATQARDTAQYYRFLLARLLREENLDLEAAAAVTSSVSLPASRVPEGGATPATYPWYGHGESPTGRLLQQLTRRMQGQLETDLARAIETTAWQLPENAEILKRMFEQLRLRLRHPRQDNEPAADVDHLSAEEARQLLRAFTRIRTREDGNDLFDAIDAGAAQALDATRYYRYLLKQSIAHGLTPSPSRGLSKMDVQVAATPHNVSAVSAAEKPTDAKHEYMTSNDSPIQQDVPAASPPGTRIPARPVNKAADILVANAGMVLAAPYLPHLFGMLELTDASKFKNASAAERAAHLSQFAVNARCDMPEFQLTLNKLLCGIALETSIVREIQPLASETQAVEGMLRAMIQHWSIIGNTSIEGLRESFLQRNGILRWRDDGWRLKVETKAIDVLVDRLPWSIAIIKSPWMDLPIHVEWR